MNVLNNILTTAKNAESFSAEFFATIAVVCCYVVISIVRTKKQNTSKKQFNAFFLYHKLWKFHQQEALALLRAWFDQAVAPKGQYILLHVLDQMSEQELARALRLMSDEEKKLWSTYLSQDKPTNIADKKMIEAKNQMLEDVLNVFGLTDNDGHMALYDALVAQDIDSIARCMAANPNEFAALIQILPSTMIQSLSQKMAGKDYASMLETAMALEHQSTNNQISRMVELLNAKIPAQENQMHQKLVQLYKMAPIEKEALLLKQIFQTGGELLLQQALSSRLPFDTILDASREVLTEAFASMSVKERARLMVGLGKDRGETMLRKCFPKSVSGYQRFQMDNGQIEACQNEIAFAWPKYLRAVDRAWCTMSGQENQRLRLQKNAMDEFTEFVPSKIHLEL
jgi:hypothetical protein